MFKTFKFSVIALGLSSAAIGANVHAAPDGHEQARQLLQRTESSTAARFADGVFAAAPQDGHEQARRLFDRSHFVAEESRAHYEGAALIVEETVDAHVKARNLLAPPLAGEAGQ